MIWYFTSVVLMRIAEVLKTEEKFRNPFCGSLDVEVMENDDVIRSEDRDVAAERNIVNELMVDNEGYKVSDMQVQFTINGNFKENVPNAYA